jgi:hypothetical protein
MVQSSKLLAMACRRDTAEVTYGLGLGSVVQRLHAALNGQARIVLVPFPRVQANFA